MLSYLEIFVCFVRKKGRKEMSDVMGLLVLEDSRVLDYTFCVVAS